MLNILRTHSPFTVILLAILALLLKLQPLLHPVAPALGEGAVFFGYVLRLTDRLLHGSAFAYTFLAVGMVFAQSVYLSGISNRHRLTQRPGYLAAFVYLCLTSCYPAFNYFSAPLLANWFLLLGLDIILSFHQQNGVRKRLFNAGFVFSLAVLVQASAVWSLLLLLMAIILLRAANPAELVVAALGCLTPFYFAVSLLFLADLLPLVKGWWTFSLSVPRRVLHPRHFFGNVGGAVFVAGAGLFSLQHSLGRLAISVRRSWGAVTSYGLVSLLIAATTPKGTDASWLVCLPPLALVGALPLGAEMNRRFGTFIAFLLPALVIFCQLSINR